MSILRNLLGNFMPHFEQRTAAGALNAINAELVLDVSGDESALINIDGGSGTLNATYVVEGSIDGISYAGLLAFSIPQFCAGGTIPLAGQPMLLEAVNAANIKRAIAVAVGGLKKIRVRLSAWTGGSAAVTINSDAQAAISPYLRDQKAATLMQSVTAAAGAAATATLPAVAGLRHYIDFIEVTRIATAALTASATPVVVTTTNLPNAPALTFGSDAGGIGIDVTKKLDFGASGLAATALGTASTIVAPAYAGVIWRINVAYRLGL